MVFPDIWHLIHANLSQKTAKSQWVSILPTFATLSLEVAKHRWIILRNCLLFSHKGLDHGKFAGILLPTQTACIIQRIGIKFEFARSLIRWQSRYKIDSFKLQMTSWLFYDWIFRSSTTSNVIVCAFSLLPSQTSQSSMLSWRPTTRASSASGNSNIFSTWKL